MQKDDLKGAIIRVGKDERGWAFARRWRALGLESANVNAVDIVTPLVVGVIGVVMGGLLARRNEKKAQGERLLVEALNDAATAIAEVAGGVGRPAQTRYASAMSRIALHASPEVISQFRAFQDDATTATQDGQERFIKAIQQARLELGHRAADDEDLAVLLFGNSETDQQFTAQCWTSAAHFRDAISSPSFRLAIEKDVDRGTQQLGESKPSGQNDR